MAYVTVKKKKGRGKMGERRGGGRKGKAEREGRKEGRMFLAH